MTDRELPEYLRVADWVLDGIASGSIGSNGITLAQIENQTGTGRGISRPAVEWLKTHRVLKGRQGRPYQVLISAEDARERRLDVRPIEEQLAELQARVTELERRLARTEATVATMSGRPARSRREAAADGGR